MPGSKFGLVLGFFHHKKEVYCITSYFLGMEMLALLGALMG